MQNWHLLVSKILSKEKGWQVNIVTCDSSNHYRSMKEIHAKNG